MTGFGTGACASGEFGVKVELRSVNHRYLDVVARLPKGYQGLEERVRRIAQGLLHRGRLEIFVSIEEYRGKRRTVTLDKGLLEGYLKALREAAEEHSLSGALTADMLLALPDLFQVEEAEADAEEVWPLLERALREAFDELRGMRDAEGERLEKEILGRLAALSGLIDRIEERAPQVVSEYRAKLEGRIGQLLQEAPVDEQRIALEVALFAERANIAEEITRARSHLEQFREVCRQGAGVGRKLDFLIQELHREVNTIASKAADLASLVVEAKAELEKIREQVQNVE